MSAPDLQRLRAGWGEAIFAARMADAEERAALCERIQAELGDGVCLAEAIRRVAPGVTDPTARTWWKRWNQAGVTGLLDRRGRPPAPRDPPASSPAAQLSLAIPPGVPQGGGAATPAGRSRVGRKPGLLKWSGSKASVVRHLVPLLPASFDAYHEPFVGSGALFFALRPARAFLSDSNAELMNLYQVVRDGPGQLIDALAQHVNTRQHYQHVRGIHPASLAPVERAARTLFLNRTCYNGLYRVNSRGLFNVPYGRREGAGFLFPETIWSAHRSLAGAGLTCADFADAAQLARPGDLVYLDPPYNVGLRGGDTYRYQAGGFADDAQARLADIVRELDRRGCHVMVSSADSSLIRRLYRGFHIEPLLVQRNIGGTAERRGRAAELVIRNYR